MFCPKCGDSVGKDEFFCNKCGHKLKDRLDTNINNNGNISVSNTNSPKSNNNIIMAVIGGVIGLAFVFIVVGLVILFGDTNYYFSEDSYNDEGVVEVESNNIVTPKKKSKYSTVIVADNYYDGVKLNTENDAINLIEKDSVEQKVNCPAEIKAIEDRIIKDYDIVAVNLCELDIEFANEIANVFDLIYKEYPSARGYLSNLSLNNASMSDSYIAAFTSAFQFASSNEVSGYPVVFKTQILLNTTYFLNTSRIDSAVKDGSASGHFPPNATRYSPVAHEMGHYLSFLSAYLVTDLDSNIYISEDNSTEFYQLLDYWFGDEYSRLLIKTAYDKYIKDTSDTIAFDDWRATISSYAVAKDNNGDYIYDETIAEGFHDVYLNGDNAKTASKYVVAVLKKRLEG